MEPIEIFVLVIAFFNAIEGLASFGMAGRGKDVQRTPAQLITSGIMSAIVAGFGFALVLAG